MEEPVKGPSHGPHPETSLPGTQPQELHAGAVFLKLAVVENSHLTLGANFSSQAAQDHRKEVGSSIL